MRFFGVSFLLLLLAVACSSQSTLPAFVTEDMSGNKIDTRQLHGKTVVVNLWFVNCPNCVEEIKQLNQIVDDYKGKSDVVFIGLAASSKNALDKFLVKNPFKYRIAPNSQMIIISQFGTPDKSGQINVPFPMHYVFDKDGKMVVKEQGIKGVAVVRSVLEKQLRLPQTGN
jgi:peroxiredoxin